MKKVLDILAVTAIADLAIVFFGMAQIAIEGRTGYWAPFWRVQAEWIINILT